MWKWFAFGVLALPLAVFLAFVGYHKVFSSMVDLARYGAYTAHLPELMGRIIGCAEIASAAALLIGIIPNWRKGVRPAGLFIILSQIASSIIHFQHAETGALPQNAVIAIVAAALIGLTRDSDRARAEATAP